MTATVTKYQNFAKVFGGAVDLNSPPSVKVTLHTSTYTPNAATQTVYADLSNELATANGYTNGGTSLASITWTSTGGVATFTAANTVITASGGSIVARYAVLRLIGTFNSQVDPLICYILMDNTPADITTTNGNTLTFAWNASGIFNNQ